MHAPADTSPWPGMQLYHSRPIPSPHTCKAAYTHDRTSLVLSLLIVIGLVVSYLPQWVRIIRHKNSEGFSPMFLLLGATSSASSLANIVTLQWSQVACCQYLVSLLPLRESCLSALTLCGPPSLPASASSRSSASARS